MGAVQWSDDAARNLWWNLGANLGANFEDLGHDRVVPVGPLLAVLMSLQQGRVGVRSTVAFRYVDLFAGFCPVSGLFLGRFQRPNTASLATAAGSRPGGMQAASVRNASVVRAMSSPK